MVHPETAVAGLAEIVAQLPHTQNFTGFSLSGLGALLPNNLQHITNTTDDVVLTAMI